MIIAVNSWDSSMLLINVELLDAKNDVFFCKISRNKFVFLYNASFIVDSIDWNIFLNSLYFFDLINSSCKYLLPVFRFSLEI